MVSAWDTELVSTYELQELLNLFVWIGVILGLFRNQKSIQFHNFSFGGGGYYGYIMETVAWISDN